MSLKEGKPMMNRDTDTINRPQWIPCEERLPDRNKYVLVTSNGEINIGKRIEWRWMDYYGDKLKDVTAWMPLPKPYQGN